ncbi:hypothetical protein KY359_03560 [Candidatus Woesearchaeota archaeon]|nr:hypothetical protein [Candidatus Woesearchaeota archaeon]
MTAEYEKRDATKQDRYRTARIYALSGLILAISHFAAFETGRKMGAEAAERRLKSSTETHQTYSPLEKEVQSEPECNFEDRNSPSYVARGTDVCKIINMAQDDIYFCANKESCIVRHQPPR